MVGLRRSPRIAAAKKNKGYLQHLGFIAIPDNPEDPNESIVLNAIASTSDILNQKEAFNHPDKPHFVDAMVTEVENLENNNVWEYVSKSMVPAGQKILRAIWSFCIKKKPPDYNKSHKARICADGSNQIEGINYTETYAPVVKWLSVRSLLTMSMLHNLETLAIDFTQAYTQAPIDTEVYMHLPPGFETDDDEVLKLKKNLYGLKQGGYNFWVKLRDFLISQEFHQSEHDHCAFIKDGIVVLSYVDDCPIFAQKGKSIKTLIEAFKDAKFDFTEEGSVSSYLGVEINRNGSQIELT